MKHIISFLLMLMALPIYGATKTWVGSTVNNNWATATNWSGGVAPVPYDDLVFSGTNKPVTTNNFAGGIYFNSITFTADATNFFLLQTGDNWIRLIGNISNQSVNTMCIQPNLEFSSSNRTVATVGDIIFSNRITQGLLTFPGPGNIYLMDAKAGLPNDNSGLIVNLLTGTVFCGKSSTSSIYAMAGITNIGTNATIKFIGSGNYQIANGAYIRNNNGVIDMDGHGFFINSLYASTNSDSNGIITNSAVSTVATATIGVASTVSFITSNRFLGGTGDIALCKTGTSVMTIYRANTFGGGVTINQGTLALGGDSQNNQNDSSLGSGDVVINNGQLRFGGNAGGLVYHYITNNIIMNGGSIWCNDGQQVITNSYTIFNGLVTLYARYFDNKFLVFATPISGNGKITCNYGGGGSGGNIIFNGQGNTFVGDMVIGPGGGIAGATFNPNWRGTGLNSVTIKGSASFLALSSTNQVCDNYGYFNCMQNGYIKVFTNSTVYNFYINDELRQGGTWGSLLSSAIYKSATYFQGTNKLTVQSGTILRIPQIMRKRLDEINKMEY